VPTGLPTGFVPTFEAPVLYEVVMTAAPSGGRRRINSSARVGRF